MSRSSPTRLRVLAAIARLVQAEITTLAEALDLDRKTIASHVSNLRVRGEIKAVAFAQSRYRTARIWAVTPIGQAVLANPAAKRVKKPTPNGRQVSAKACYAEQHKQHVARQRKLGIPEALIGAELLDAMPTTRGVA